MRHCMYQARFYFGEDDFVGKEVIPDTVLTLDDIQDMIINYHQEISEICRSPHPWIGITDFSIFCDPTDGSDRHFVATIVIKENISEKEFLDEVSEVTVFKDYLSKGEKENRRMVYSL